MRLVLVALLAAGCSETKSAGRDSFVTPCGVTVRGMPALWTPAEVAMNETRVMGRFDAVTDPRFADACRRVRGAELWFRPDYVWTDEYGRRVHGLTDCKLRRAYVGALPDVQLTAMGHELAHLIQRCTPLGPKVDKNADASHANWWRDGIYVASEGL